MSETEHQNFVKYLQGSEEAFQKIYNKYSPRIYGYIKNKVQNPDIANDILQEVFLKMHKSRKTYNSKYPLSVWLFTITKSSIIDYYRRNTKHDASEFYDSHKSREGIRPEIDLSILSPEERKLIHSRFFEDKSYKEIEDLVGKNSNSLRKRVERALKKLKKHGGRTKHAG